jgi:hypothetical protein
MSTNVSPALPTRTRRAAFVSVAAPLLCAVHCMAAPLLVALTPALGHGPAEIAIQAATLAFAVVLLRAGLRTHGRRAVIAPVALGAAAWMAGHAAPESAETMFSVAGGLLIAAGMLWNARLRHEAVCHSCGCPAHGHED